jgi:glycosyltransferase involved in cell wall biosynthesis
VCVFTGYPSQARLPDDRRLEPSSYEGIEVRRFHWSFTPSATQVDAYESEYNNALSGVQFRDYLAGAKPDVVHFFHLYRLSGSTIDACVSQGVPTLYTATDFWFVCPTADLRLPGAAMCDGPRADGVNCIRHLFGASPVPGRSDVLGQLPDAAIVQVVASLRDGPRSSRRLDQQIRAIADRPSFLMDRLNKVDRVLAPSRVTERVLTQHGLHRERVHYSRFGIDLAPFEGLVRRTSADGCLRLGYVGRIVSQKGVHVLLHAMRALPPSVAVELSIWGGAGGDRRYAEEMRSLAGDDARVQFRGPFEPARVGDVYRDLDALVVPSICHENTPLVVYEAQAARCPVIASNVEGIAELIQHEHNGLLFEMGNADQLAAAIRRVTEDRDLVHRLAAQSLHPKSIVEYADELLGMYGELLNCRAKTAATNGAARM